MRRGFAVQGIRLRRHPDRGVPGERAVGALVLPGAMGSGVVVPLILLCFVLSAIMFASSRSKNENIKQ